MLFQFKSLQTKLAIIVGCFVLFMFVTVMFTLNIVQNKTNDAASIGIAGRQQILIVMLENKTHKLIELLESESSSTVTQSELEKMVEEFDHSLRALKQGGEALTTEGQIIQLRPSEGIIQQQLKMTWQLWLPMRGALQILQNTYIDATSDEFYDAIMYLEKTGRYYIN